MRRHIAPLALALVIVAAAGGAAAQTLESGTVVRVDPQSSVIVLDDGRMFRVTPNTVVLIDNRPTAFPTLRPGARVVIQSAEPVIFRDGRYVTLSAPPVVAQAPPATAPPAAVAVPAGVKQTIYGTVADVDRDGTVKIKTDRDDFEARISQQAARQLRKGDTVIIDMTFTAPGTPAAFPR